ncbi:hypothetical protein ACFQ9U_19650 [Streptomyces sp. NPDC056568]|uniref:hypothetical protein n=1 Tax=Streptomyces sp. NPDC056568 TaxID=3345866 RepID=UPI0036B85204
MSGAFVYPFAATLLPGHRLVAELSNDEPLADAHNALLLPDAFHPSRMAPPFTTRAARAA